MKMECRGVGRLIDLGDVKSKQEKKSVYRTRRCEGKAEKEICSVVKLPNWYRRTFCDGTEDGKAIFHPAVQPKTVSGLVWCEIQHLAVIV